jgi:hypothetical protein
VHNGNTKLVECEEKEKSVFSLDTFVKQEKKKKSEVGKVPDHYMKLSFVFFSKSSEIIRDLYAVKSLVEDIWRIWVEKIRSLNWTGTLILSRWRTAPEWNFICFENR